MDIDMLNHFRILPFLVGIGLGVYLVFNFNPEQPVLVKFPHPDNIDTVFYRDKASACYKYKVTSVDCDKNEKNLKEYPLQA
jgi:hypothetical protein